RQASRAQPRGKPGFSTLESSSGRETDSPLEEPGFEPLVPPWFSSWSGRPISLTGPALPSAGPENKRLSCDRRRVSRPDRYRGRSGGLVGALFGEHGPAGGEQASSAAKACAKTSESWLSLIVLLFFEKRAAAATKRKRATEPCRR